HLENWHKDKLYDRVGLNEETLRILDTEITKKTIPVRPGRNVAVIIEVAAMNYRLNIMGINTAEEFNDRLNAEIMRNGSNNKEKDRKSTRLNSSHVSISYAVFCLKKKK